MCQLFTSLSNVKSRLGFWSNWIVAFWGALFELDCCSVLRNPTWDCEIGDWFKIVGLANWNKFIRKFKESKEETRWARELWTMTRNFPKPSSAKVTDLTLNIPCTVRNHKKRGGVGGGGGGNNLALKVLVLREFLQNCVDQRIGRQGKDHSLSHGAWAGVHWQSSPSLNHRAAEKQITWRERERELKTITPKSS